MEVSSFRMITFCQFDMILQYLTWFYLSLSHFRKMVNKGTGPKFPKTDLEKGKNGWHCACIFNHLKSGKPSIYCDSNALQVFLNPNNYEQPYVASIDFQIIDMGVRVYATEQIRIWSSSSTGWCSFLIIWCAKWNANHIPFAF